MLTGSESGHRKTFTEQLQLKTLEGNLKKGWWWGKHFAFQKGQRENNHVM